MKQKKFKFSLGLKIATILSCLALVSMGFASWWIVKPPVERKAEGSFEVYTVDTKNINITEPKFKNIDNTETSSSLIIFGKKDFEEEDGTNYRWLLAGDEIKDQNLQAVMTFQVSVTDGEAATGTSNLAEFLESVNLTMTVPAALKTAIKDKYIDANNTKITYTYTPAGGTEQSRSVSIDGKEDSVELPIVMSGATGNTPVYSVDVTVTFDFAWGEMFDYKNPYIYFNSKEYDEDLADDANDYLNVIYGLNAGKYEVTLKGVLKD